MKIFLIVFLWLCALNMCSQTPGYMGKKTSLGYGVFMSPVLFPFVSGASENKLNLLHDFFIERTLKVNVSAGFFIGVLKRCMTIQLW